MYKLSAFTLVLCAALLLSLTAVAQETPVPPAGEFQGEFQPEIMEVVSNTEEYVGATVTLEGTITELVNVKLFVLDDGALLATNQVIVLNNSGQEYPIWVSADQRVRVTGVVHPRRVDGGLEALINRAPVMTEATPQTVEATPDAIEETPEMMDVTPETMDTAPDRSPVLDDRYGYASPLTLDVIPDRLEDWVIIEVTSIENLAHIRE